MPNYIEGEFYMARYFGDKRIKADEHLKPYRYSEGNLCEGELPNDVPSHWRRPMRDFFIKEHIDKGVAIAAIGEGRKIAQTIRSKADKQVRAIRDTQDRDIKKAVTMFWDSVVTGDTVKRAIKHIYESGASK